MSASGGVGSYNPLSEAEDDSKQKSSLMSRIFGIRRRRNITSAIPSYRAPSTPDMEWDPISLMEQGTRIAQDSDSQKTNISVYNFSIAHHTSQQFEEEDERDENKLRRRNITSAIPQYRAPSTPDMEWDPTSVLEQGIRIAQDSDSQKTNISVYNFSIAHHTSQQFEEEDERDENKLRLKEEEVQR